MFYEMYEIVFSIKGLTLCGINARLAAKPHGAQAKAGAEKRRPFNAVNVIPYYSYCDNDVEIVKMLVVKRQDWQISFGGW